MLQYHDGSHLFDVGPGSCDHDVFGHQFLAGLIEEVFKFFDILTNAVGIHLGPHKRQTRQMRLRAAVHEVGTGNEADEMAVVIDDGYGQEAMLDKQAKYVANGRIRRN